MDALILAERICNLMDAHEIEIQLPCAAAHLRTCGTLAVVLFWLDDTPGVGMGSRAIVCYEKPEERELAQQHAQALLNQPPEIDPETGEEIDGLCAVSLATWRDGKLHLEPAG